MDNTNKKKTFSKNEIKQKYGLTEKEFENLRRRTGERIRTAQALYGWDDEALPTVNYLIDYSIKRQRGQIVHPRYQYDAILELGATRISRSITKSNVQKAFERVTGKKPFSPAIHSFMARVQQFIILKTNLEKAQAGLTNFEQLPLFAVGRKFGESVGGYRIRNNDTGRQYVNELNNIVNDYNSNLSSMNAENAVIRYLNYARRFNEIFNNAFDDDKIYGS